MICFSFFSYGHLDLLTSMYSYQDATKENMHKPTWNLVKILITGTIFFYFTQQQISHESPFKFEFVINFQNIILNKRITNSNIFFTLIDGRGIGITFGTQITFTFLEFFFLYSFFFIFCMHTFFVEGKSFVMPMPLPSISVKKILLFVIRLFKIIFWKFITNSNLNGDSCWIKVQKIFIVHLR
jgi:hypothetical protein